MKVISHAERLLEQPPRAAEAAMRETLGEMQANAPRQSGAYAAGLRLEIERDGDQVRGRYVSDHRAASALEHGANVGDRRGPHMGAQPHIRPAREKFPERMVRHLQAAGR